MKICMSGIDFQTASIETRENFSIMEKELGLLAKKIKDENNVSGCVLISTCNRTEIYVTPDGELEKSPSEMLFNAAGFDDMDLCDKFISREDGKAIRHLMELSAGLHSQIFGDDQIIAQVKRALQAAHDENATDCYLETLFRHAVTAAKKVKSNVRLSAVGSSVANLAVNVLKKKLGDLCGVKGMVIGNGEIGRLAAELLEKEGAEITITVREYKHKPVITPYGCQPIMYSNRYIHMNECDFVVSATTSPHFTITKEALEKIKHVPQIFVDLAVPRDVEASISSLGSTIYNMDDLGDSTDSKIGLSEAMLIIDEYEQKYYNWYNFKISSLGFFDSGLKGLNI